MKNKNRAPVVSDEVFKKTAFKVSAVSIIGNIVLSIFKVFAGVFGHSGAMISDAVHSLSDVFSTIIVVIGVKLASKESDKEHPYGHERIECVAALVLAVILLVSGLFIGEAAAEQIISRKYETIAVPGLLALIATVVSIVVKESMFWYTRYFAKKLRSGALMADAYHHRSDAFSSVGAFIGIFCARMGYPVMDSIASLFICLFIIKAAFDIFKETVEKMVDRSCDCDTEQEIRDHVKEIEGVMGVDLLRTRVFGNKIYVDIEICADCEITLKEGHDIAHRVHDSIEETFPEVKHIMVHVNPYFEKTS